MLEDNILQTEMSVQEEVNFGFSLLAGVVLN